MLLLMGYLMQSNEKKNGVLTMTMIKLRVTIRVRMSSLGHVEACV